MIKSISLRDRSNYNLIAIADKFLNENPQWIVKRDIYWEAKVTGIPLSFEFNYVIELEETIEPEHKNSAPTPANATYNANATNIALGSIAEMIFFYYSGRGIEPEAFENLIRNGFMKIKPDGKTATWTDKAHELANRFKQLAK